MSSTSLVASAKNPRQRVLPDPIAETDRDEVRLAAARMLAAGFSAKQVGKALVKWLTDDSNEVQATKKLRRWMRRDPKFRDLIYQEAVVKLDLSSPDILDGLRKSARRGRVDAARFALELTGRYSKDEAPVTTVNVVLSNMARPEQ